MEEKSLPITLYDGGMIARSIIEDYYSLLISELYSEEGYFTLELPSYYFENPDITPGSFMIMEQSERVMVISDINPVLDSDGGSKLVLTGPTAETILKWRVTEELIFFDGNLQTNIETLIDMLFINPTDTDRDVPGFIMETSTDPAVTGITYTNVFEPATAYDIIKAMCDATDLGFKVVHDEDTGQFIFSLYSGKDRSYAQSTNPYVIFSDDYDNIVDSSFYVAFVDYKNVIVVYTEDTVYPVVYAYFGTEPQNWQRREMSMDGTGINRSVPGGPDLTDSEYLAVVTQKGLEKLSEFQPTGVFDGNIDIHGSFEYEKDFFLGDVLQCVIHGIDVEARLIELVRSIAEDGIVSYASFKFENLF